MKLYYSILVLFICLVASSVVVSAASTIINSGSRGLQISPNIPIAIPQNQTREFEIHLVNDSTIIQSGATCFLHIYEEYKSGGHLYINQSSTFSNQDIEFIIPPNVHEYKGQYSFKVYCNTTGGQASIYESDYYVTKYGNAPAGDNLKIFIYFLFIVCFVGLFYTFFITLAKTATAETTIYDILLSIASYLLLFPTLYLAQNFLITTFIEDNIYFLMLVTRWTNVLFPIISFIVTIIIKSTTKKRPLSVQEISGGLH